MKSLFITDTQLSKKYDFLDKNLIKKGISSILEDIPGFLNQTFIKNEKYNIYIFASGSLECPLIYPGVTIALWIYTHLILKGFYNFQIILIGSETLGAFMMHCKYANIVSSCNVHYVENSKESLESFINLKVIDSTFSLSKEELITALKNVNIEPPSAFKNTHTLINEWCISRWSKAVGLEYPNIRLDQTLYFPYLKSTLPISTIPSLKNNLTISDIRDKSILVIDDEVEKGWKAFFETLFPNKVISIGEEFKSIKSREEIITKIKKYVEDLDPDIVILDLRLHDLDHDTSTKGRLTGINVLREIKNINKGIQVIGFTASNKVWNLLDWQEFGIDNFIIKESPVLSTEKDYTKKSIQHLIKAIKTAAEKTYLKKIYTDNKKALELVRNLKKDRIINSDLANFLTRYLNLAQSSLFSDKPNNDTAFMYYFLILEAFSNLLIDFEGVKSQSGLYNIMFRFDDIPLAVFDERTGKKTMQNLTEGKLKETDHLRISYNQKLYNMIDYVGLTDINPINLVKTRNKFNHPNLQESTPIVLHKEDVINVKNVVCGLINKFYHKSINKNN